MTVMEPEFTDLATRIATAIKFKKLREERPQSEVEGIVMDCVPSNEEVIAVKHTMRLIVQAGYNINRS
jgi:hypothetical protein